MEVNAIEVDPESRGMWWATVSHSNSCYTVCQVFAYHSFILFIYVDLFI